MATSIGVTGVEIVKPPEVRVGRADCHDALHKVCESLEAYTWIG